MLRQLVYLNVYLGLCLMLLFKLLSKTTSNISSISANLIGISILLLTVSIYSFDRLIDAQKDLISYPLRSRLYIKYKVPIFLLSITAFISSIFLFSKVNVKLLIIPFIPLFGSYIYAKGFSLFNNQLKIPLKSYNFKNIFVSSLLTSTIICPIILTSEIFRIKEFIIISVFIFSQIAIGASALDIRDIRSDIQNKVNTLATKFGINKTSGNLVLLNTFTILIITPILIDNSANIALKIALIAFFSYKQLYLLSLKKIYHFTKYQSKFLFEMVVDGELIVFYLAFILASNFSSLLSF